MKLADVLKNVGSEERRQEVGSEPLPAPAAGSGYRATGEGRPSPKATGCLRCGRPIAKGDWTVALGSNAWNNRTWVHPECEHSHVTGTPGVDKSEIEGLAERVASRLDSALLAEIDRLNAKVSDLAEAGSSTVVEVRLPDKTIELEGEFLHPAFEEVVLLAASGQPVFIPGPTGSGKSHLARQVANALGRRFGSISFSGGTSEAALIGRMVPYGENGQFEFLGTQFLDCYENGGVFLADELDAADPNVLIAINSALANGFISVPARHENPTATMHKDFAIIAAANTYGRGADRLYTARSDMDESTLDRFRMGTVPVDYDRQLEKRLCPNSDLRNRLEEYRTKTVDFKLERVVSTRFMRDAYLAYRRWELDGNTYGYSSIYDYIDSKLFGGWTDREVVMVRGSLPRRAGE